MTPFMTMLLEGSISAISHAIAGMHLSPLRFSKKKTICLWTIYVLLFVTNGFHIVPLVKENPMLSSTWFFFLYLIHILLYFFTTQTLLYKWIFLLHVLLSYHYCQ